MGEREHCLSLWFMQQPLQLGGSLPKSWQLLYPLLNDILSVKQWLSLWLSLPRPNPGHERWALCQVPALRSQTLEPSSPHSDACTQVAVMIEYVESDLEDSSCLWSDIAELSLLCVFLVCFFILHSHLCPVAFFSLYFIDRQRQRAILFFFFFSTNIHLDQLRNVVP